MVDANPKKHISLQVLHKAALFCYGSEQVGVAYKYMIVVQDTNEKN